MMVDDQPPVLAMPHLDTPRLHLRPLGEGDEALFCQLYTDPQVMRHIGTPLSRDAAQRSFRVACGQAAWPTQKPWWVATERGSCTGIGLLGMVRRGDSAEIGIVLLPDGQARGFGAEALTALAAAALQEGGLASLWLAHSPDNHAMLGLMAKLAFRRDGRIGQDARIRWNLAL